ncbi:M16 family metallopeptidase [Acrocarpospora catenulata]|uniref:M16 family metallopeptidase n=1 Tax=Acrocarpospora catenulata TaxID=2836182 RepID=UPI001BD96674|nr:insulinase family protein [Acrocarpospora catenulata]
MRSGIVDRTLGNGLRVLTLRHGVTPLVEVRLHLPAPCPTPRDLAESALLAACLPYWQGTNEGVELRAVADVYRMTVSACCSGHEMNALLQTLAEVVRGGVPAEVGAARDQLIAQLRVARAHPEAEVRSELARRLFGDHPVTFQAPEEKELAEIARLRPRPFDPRGALLVILAPDDPERMADAADRTLSHWQPAGRGAQPLPPLSEIEGGQLALLPRPGAPQSLIRLRAQAVATGDQLYPALFLASSVMGGYFSSRLPRSLREDKGYVYGVSAFFDTRPGSGLLAIEADTAAPTTDATMEALTAELRRMRTHPPTRQEIHGARTYALGSMATRLAPRPALASAFADLAAKAVDPCWLLDFPRRLAAVTPDAVVAAAEEFLAPERFSGVVAADPGVLGECGAVLDLTAGRRPHSPA